MVTVQSKLDLWLSGQYGDNILKYSNKLKTLILYYNVYFHSLILSVCQQMI